MAKTIMKIIMLVLVKGTNNCSIMTRQHWFPLIAIKVNCKAVTPGLSKEDLSPGDVLVMEFEYKSGHTRV